MSYSRFDPGCCCDAPCEIFADDFETDGELGLPDYEVLSGTPTKDGGTVEMSAGDAFVVTVEPEDAGDGYTVTVRWQKITSDATFELWGAWADADHYLFGEVAIAGGTATLRIGQVHDGTSSWLTDPIVVTDAGEDLDGWHSASLCVRLGEVLPAEEMTKGPILPWRAVDLTGAGLWTDLPLIEEFEGGAGQGTFPTGDPDTDELQLLFKFNFPPGGKDGRLSVGILTDYSAVDPVDAITDHTVQVFEATSGYSSVDLANDLNSLPENGISPPANIGWGLPWTTDLWFNGMELTSEILNSSQFLVHVVLRRDPAAGGQVVNVYHALAAARVTLPERRMGQVSLTFGNTSVTAVDCLNEYSASVSDTGLDGKRAGLTVTAGTVEFDSFALTYQYDAALRPNCPKCGTYPDCPPCNCTDPDGDGEPGGGPYGGAEPCPVCEDILAEYKVTIPANDLADGFEGCNACATLQGDFIVRSWAPCGWKYEDEPCTFDLMPVRRSIFVAINSDGTFHWLVAEVKVWWKRADGVVAEAVAFYRSDNFSAEDPCVPAPVTLTLFWFYVLDTLAPLPCGDYEEMPLTLTLDVP